ncbi:MAG: hypothetical protein JWO60_576 [Frankiales bacterium]|nr:hypothetical protein [Frankiales bacterium]
MRSLLVLVLLLPLAACGGGEDADPAAQPSASAPPSASASSSAAAAALVPTGKGLTVGGQDLPFGSPKAAVTAALVAVLGAEDPAQEVSCDAPGPRTAASFGGQDFVVLFDETGGLVGWDSREGEITTDVGLRVGSTRADVEKALPGAEFVKTNIGQEFGDAGGISGVLDGESPTSKVDDLVGGQDCFAR